MASSLASDSTVIDPQLFRRTLSEFASGVTVITGGTRREPLGFVCQSFSSVSLAPPLVMFCVDHSSRTWPRLRPSGRFCVNILAEDQEDICWRFGSRTGQKFDGLDWDWSVWQTPMLRDCLAQIECEIKSVHSEGDHDIVIGRVLHMAPAPVRKRPMLFFRGTFDVDAHSAETMKVWDLSGGWI